MLEIFISIGLLVLYFIINKNIKKYKDSESKKQQPYLILEEIKLLGSHGAKLSRYSDGTCTAVRFYIGKGGRNISVEEFAILDFQRATGGVWTQEFFNVDGAVLKKIDLFTSLSNSSSASTNETKVSVPRRDYGL